MAVPDMVGVEPIRIVRPEGTAAGAEMVTLFIIDDVEYQVPARPRVNVALKFLWHARQYGETDAAGVLLEELLGEKGFKALMEYDELEDDQFASIMKAAQKLALGSLEKKSGKSSSGPRK